MWIPYHRRPSFASHKKTAKNASDEEEFESNFLRDPRTEKLHCKNLMLNSMEIGHASMQGYRVNMEDEFIIDAMDSLPDHTFVAILDGHGGKLTAQYVSLHLKNIIEQTSPWIEYTKTKAGSRSLKTDLLSEALVRAYEVIDDKLHKIYNNNHMGDESGCTAVCAIITPSHVICANVGDSRCVVGGRVQGSSRDNNPRFDTISLTEDHKPSNPEEKKRIEEAGDFVFVDRVNGELAMSRALGDFRYKSNATLRPDQYSVICYPDVSVYVRTGSNDSILVLACDGVWDVMSNNEAISYLVDIVFKDKQSLLIPNRTSSSTTTTSKIVVAQSTSTSIVKKKTINSTNTTTTTSHVIHSSSSVDDDDDDDDNHNDASLDRVVSDEESSVDTLSSLHTIPPTSSNSNSNTSHPSSSSSANKRKRSSQQHHHHHQQQLPEQAVNTHNYVTAQEAAESIIDLALADGSMDNISAIVLKFL